MTGNIPLLTLAINKLTDELTTFGTKNIGG